VKIRNAPASDPKSSASAQRPPVNGDLESVIAVREKGLGAARRIGQSLKGRNASTTH